VTLHYTTNYGIAYLGTETPLKDLATSTQQAAESLDAAMGRAGYVPPDATTFAALNAKVNTDSGRIGTLETAKTTDEGRITVLEGYAPTAPAAPTLGASFVAFNTQAAGGDFQSLRLWKVGQTVYGSGFVKFAAAGTVADLLLATIPAGLRPTFLTRVPAGIALVTAGTTITTQRVDAYADGRLNLSATVAFASGSSVALTLHWPIP
jgi:hypothetical protein